MGKWPRLEDWKVKKKKKKITIMAIQMHKNNWCRGQNSKRKYPEKKPGGLPVRHSVWISLKVRFG